MSGFWKRPCVKGGKMKNYFLTLFLICLITFAACGCTNNPTSQTKPVPEQKAEIKENPVNIASPAFSSGISSMLNQGFSIVNKNKIYYTKSADFEKVYFFGTVVEKGGQYYNAIWATNEIEFFGGGLIYSINDYAYQASGMAKGETNKEPINEYDDGYSRINQKLLNDFDNLIK